MDTPVAESSELNLQEAAAEFAKMLEPETPEEPKEQPKEELKAEPEKEPEPNAQEEGADAPITIEVDGKQVTLTKEQLAEAYKSGLRQEDYTRKTMAAAEERKAAEAERTKAVEERRSNAERLNKMEAAIETALQVQSGTDWNALRESNPAEFLKQWHQQSQWQAALQQIRGEKQALQQQEQAEQAKAHKAYLEEQQSHLIAKLPEWKDPAKAEAEKAALAKYLVDTGYSKKDVDGVTDHRAVVLARKAMLYDQMMAKADAAVKKVTAAPTKVQQPGTVTDKNPLDGRTAAIRNHAKAGSVESLAEVFKQII